MTLSLISLEKNKEKGKVKQMPTPVEIRQICTKWIEDRWPTLVNRQTVYFAARGRYFQGLSTHGSSLPEDGVEVKPTTLNTIKPTDQTDYWKDFWNLNTDLPVALKIDSYDGPLGKGFVVTFMVNLSKGKWIKIKQSGPEAGRERDWHQVPFETNPT